MALVPLVVLVDTDSGEIVVEDGQERLHRARLVASHPVDCPVARARADADWDAASGMTPSAYIPVPRSPYDPDLPNRWSVGEMDVLFADDVHVASPLQDRHGRSVWRTDEPMQVIESVLSAYTDALHQLDAADGRDFLRIAYPAADSLPAQPAGEPASSLQSEHEGLAEVVPMARRSAGGFGG